MHPVWSRLPAQANVDAGITKIICKFLEIVEMSSKVIKTRSGDQLQALRAEDERFRSEKSEKLSSGPIPPRVRFRHISDSTISDKSVGQKSSLKKL